MRFLSMVKFDMGIKINGTVPVHKIFADDILIPFNQRPYEWSNDLIEGLNLLK